MLQPPCQRADEQVGCQRDGHRSGNPHFRLPPRKSGELITQPFAFFDQAGDLLTHPANLFLENLLVGLGFQIIASLAGTLVQILVPEELRGRVKGIYSLVLFGTLPIGALAGGAAAERIGPQLTVLSGAIVMLLFASALYLSHLNYERSSKKEITMKVLNYAINSYILFKWEGLIDINTFQDKMDTIQLFINMEQASVSEGKLY